MIRFVFHLLILYSVSSFCCAMDLRYSGFLSIGAGKVDTDDFSYGDLDEDWSFDNDSVLGLQIKAILSDKLQFVGQAVARGYAEDDSRDYNLQVEWAYFSYEITPTISARIGRLGLPWYMISDFIEVGAAYLWVRPPTPVYEPLQSSFRHHDGFDLLFRYPLGNAYINTQLFFASYEVENNILRSDAPHFWGVNTSYVNDNFSLRFAFVDNIVELTVPDIDIYRALLQTDLPVVPGLAPILSFTETGKSRFLYRAVGFRWETPLATIESEATEVVSDVKFLPNGRSWYFSLSKPFDRITPYLVVGELHSVIDRDLGNEITQSYGGTTTALSTLIIQITEVLQKTLSRHHVSHIAGVRYDITDRLSVKFEAEQITPKGGRSSVLIPDNPFNFNYIKIRAYSIVVDWTF